MSSEPHTLQISQRVDELESKVARLEAKCENLRLQVVYWHDAAMTQRSSLQEAYRAVGANHLGDWNGAQPVVDRVAELEAQLAEA